MSADGRHGCATVRIGSWTDALEQRTRVRNNPKRAVLALHDLAQLLLAILGTDAQDDRLGTHQRNKRVHVHLQRISIIVYPFDDRTPDVEQKGLPFWLQHRRCAGEFLTLCWRNDVVML